MIITLWALVGLTFGLTARAHDGKTKAADLCAMWCVGLAVLGMAVWRTWM